MTFTYLKKNNAALCWLIALTLLVPMSAGAQSGGLALSVTPTLFEMTAVPEQVWSSSVKVINSNPHALTVYADVVNFAPQGESGQGKFLPVFEDFTEGTTLAEWIDITEEAVTIAPGESESIPFTVRVPDNAAPGGHFAAILIGTRPPQDGNEFSIGTSQIVTSLFFVRLAGDVIEDGQIREFRTVDSFLSKPEVDFAVRFENKGNVHIQPQGEIVIRNMWGKERGLIPINHHTHFGNVLPESIRKFEFMWRGEQSFSDIGRYSAELTLAYGASNRQFVSSKTYFWIVPIKSVLTVLFSIGLLVAFVMWMIKSYIRRMLILEGYQVNTRRRQLTPQAGDVRIDQSSITAPVKAGWLDLTERLRQTRAFVDTLKALASFCWQYRLFFGAVLGSILIVAIIWYFAVSVLREARDYEVTIENAGTDITLSSEEILYQQQSGETEVAPAASATTVTEEEGEVQDYEIVIVNSSDSTGLAAATQRHLEPEYAIASLRSDFETSKDRSVIVYHPDLQAEALELRSLLGDFILSALPPDSDERIITIYLGNDYASE